MRVISFLLAYLFSFSLLAKQPLLDSAKQAYDNGLYSKSVEYYEQILNTQMRSSELHYNLGNAYYRTNNIGKAILNYEKALFLDPSNEDALFNLQIAQGNKIDQFDNIPTISWENLMKKVNAFVPFWIITLLSILLIAISLVWYLFKIKSGNKKLALNYILVIVGLLLSFVSIQQKSAVTALSNGIIVQPEVNILSEPNESSKVLFTLHGGTKLRLIKSEKKWLNVKAPNNEKGWLNKDDIEIIQ